MGLYFTARVQAIGRLAIPKEIRERFGIRKGDLITVRIEKVTAGKRKLPRQETNKRP
ncbi:MAG: AbrB/MazE/SpoVT family DNA-binding domain-containing protein [Nitrososphaerota archaeon]|nr:AbrB/MazE/SpoVT family DNA-binding domain-containing protein [Nitrososphaerota archaeon]